MNNRRKLVIALGVSGLTTPPSSFAQQQKIARIGFLSFGNASGMKANRVEVFRTALRDLGYFEGKNIMIEYR